MPVIRVPPDYKPSTLDRKTKLKLVTDALVNAQGDAFAGMLILELTKANKLDQLQRREIIWVLETIQKANHDVFFVLSEKLSSWISEDSVPTIWTKHLDDQFGPKWRGLLEEGAIVLRLQDGFDNWCEAQRHKQSMTLANLSIEGREKVLATVTAIYACFELSSNPKVIITWSPSSSTDNYEARKLSLEFLTNKEAVREYKFQTDRRIDVEIEVKEFFRLRDELLALYAPEGETAESELDRPAPFSPNAFAQFEGSLKWQDIKIQFVDGHNVRISARDLNEIVNYTEMGFEDARKHLPNFQWSLLKILANNKGQISWEDSEAADNIRKRKQALSDTLKRFFQIDDDPFHPYKEEGAYRTKFTLKGESD